MTTDRRIINVILLLLLAAAVVVSSARAQVTGNLDKLREYIERNQELLLQAESLVRTTSSAKARASLDAARQLHVASIKELESGRPVIAATVAKQARNAILKAIQLAKRETKLEERALNAIDFAQRRNEYARSLFDEAGDRGNLPAEKLIEEAANQLLRARDSMREHMFEVAIQSATASTDMSNRAIRLLKRDAVGPRVVEREIARTDRLLERVDERVGRLDAPELARALAQAHDLQDRARDALRQGRYPLALENTRRARSIARRVLGRTGYSPGATADGVARAVELTDGLIEQAYTIARESGDDGAARKLDEAARVQRRAHQAYDAGRLQQAYSFTRRARDMARQTMRGLDRPVDAKTARGVLESTDRTVARLKEALGGARNEIAADLYERATARQAAAWEAYESGDVRKALANTKVARNLANMALQQLRHE